MYAYGDPKSRCSTPCFGLENPNPVDELFGYTVTFFCGQEWAFWMVSESNSPSNSFLKFTIKSNVSWKHETLYVSPQLMGKVKAINGFFREVRFATAAKKSRMKSIRVRTIVCIEVKLCSESITVFLSLNCILL